MEESCIPIGEWEFERIPSGGAEDCFHHEGVGRREYSKGSREEFPIRLGGRMIRGGGEYSSVSERREIFRGGGVVGRKEVSQMGRKTRHFYMLLCTLLNTASFAAPPISLR